MKRFIAALVLMLGTSTSAFAIPWYFSGSITINRASLTSQDVYSAALETCYGYFGGVEWNCQISGAHEIMSDAGQRPPGTNGPNPRTVFAMGEYNGNVRVTGQWDSCYRASINVVALGTNQTVSDFHGSNQVCVVPRDPIEKPDTHYCPVVLDLDNNGYRLGGLDTPVVFDIDADGGLDLLAWTAAGSRDALLVRDLNGNGRIDDGLELFGAATKLSDGNAATVGFIALGDLDVPANGGNADGRIDASDAAFAELRVWIDANADAITQDGELQSLASVGVKRLEYDFDTSNRRDANGNLLRYRARGTILNPAGQERATNIYDVIFAH